MKIHPHIIFFRHGQTTYTNVYPDLTPVGMEQVANSAKRIKEICRNTAPDKVKIVTSAAIRARGTADIIAGEINNTQTIEISHLLRDVELRNMEKAMSIFSKIKNSGKSIEEAYFTDPRFDDQSVFEPKKTIKERFYSFLYEKMRNSMNNPSECLIAVSHFEVLSDPLRRLLSKSFYLPHADFYTLRFLEVDSEGKGNIEICYRDEVLRDVLPPL